eukprot:TRINITY_DN11160_c0_g1_i1.p1 TRINITY_DN11160_c0_g1~~TRINITY_DN11160_c0_g1_i1.p1  ORF type:complete len:108 (-),score=5.03 TRINITY_DN11160_c0_g1_i1:62-385(-)
MFAYGLLHNEQNISKAQSLYKSAASKDIFAARMRNEMRDIQNALTQSTKENNISMSLNIIIGICLIWICNFGNGRRIHQIVIWTLMLLWIACENVYFCMGNARFCIV